MAVIRSEVLKKHKGLKELPNSEQKIIADQVHHIFDTNNALETAYKIAVAQAPEPKQFIEQPDGRRLLRTKIKWPTGIRDETETALAHVEKLKTHEHPAVVKFAEKEEIYLKKIHETYFHP